MRSLNLAIERVKKSTFKIGCIFMLVNTYIGISFSFTPIAPVIANRCNFIVHENHNVFKLCETTKHKQRSYARQFTTTNLFSQNSKVSEGDSTIQTSKVSSEVEILKKQAQRARLEADKLEATLTLKKLSDLEKKLNLAISNGGDKDEIKLQIEQLAKREDPSFVPRFSIPSSKSKTPTSSSPVYQRKSPIVGDNDASSNSLPELSPTELLEACLNFKRLPKQMQVALGEVANLKTNGDDDEVAIDKIIQVLYRQQKTLLANPTKLQQIYEKTMKEPKTKTKQAAINILLGRNENEEDDPDKQRLKRFIELNYPPRTRKEGQFPTEEDALFFSTEVLDAKNVFSPKSKPEEIPGGYIIRGKSMIKKDENLIEAIDKKFMQSKLGEKFNFFYVRDPTVLANAQYVESFEALLGEPVLVLFGRDMAPDPKYRFIFSILVNALTLGITFFFAAGCFGANEVILERLKEASDAGTVDTNFFSNLISQLIFPLIGIQVAHDSAHLIYSKLNNFKITSPIFIPAFGLPFFGTNVAMKTPPPNVKSLFDFSVSGPVVGILASLTLLLTGLQMTNVADASVSAYFPSLPVALVKSSSLGGTIIETLTGGALSPLLGSDSLSLHPFAIAGYIGLLINALNLLPLGCTDGGKMAHAVFGREGSSVFKTIAALAVLVSTFFGSDPNNILLGYFFLGPLGNSDFEIPCRDELEPLPLSRCFLAIGLWAFTLLTLYPLTFGN